MRYDFTTILDRTGKDSEAFEVDPIPGVQIREGFSRIPMWIADMSFATAPSVQNAMLQRLQHPAYGYFNPSAAYYDAILGWQSDRTGMSGLTRENIGYENGVLGALSSALRVLCAPGDSVLVHSPTYIGFTKTLRSSGLNMVHSPLVQDDGGVWRMDYADMDRKIKENKIHTAILCSPHNPSGRVWERGELEAAMEVFKDNDVAVISDEIWSDLLMVGEKHIPTQSVSEDAKNRTVAFYAPSKTFNLAGLVGSYHIIYNKTLRERVEKAGAVTHYNDMNVLSMHALIGAYSSEGRDWLEELRQVLTDNVAFACDYIARRFQGVDVTRPQGTYILFLDCTRWCREHNRSLDELLRAGAEVGVMWQDGRAFNGPCHIRMNLSLPTKLLKEAMERLDKYAFNG